MSDPETIPAGVHPEVELLPWYANGTLGTTDRQRVTHHLESCQDCRRELDDLTRMMRSVQAVYREQPEPSTRLARSVMARVAAEPRARENQQMPWSAVIDGWFRSFFMPRWVPTLAAVLLIAQMSLLRLGRAASGGAQRGNDTFCGDAGAEARGPVPACCHRRADRLVAATLACPGHRRSNGRRGVYDQPEHTEIQPPRLPSCVNSAMSSARPNW